MKTPKEIADEITTEIHLNHSVSISEFSYMALDKMIAAAIQKERNRSVEVIKYCEPHLDQMWAASVVGMLLDCDFREAAQTLKNHKEADNDL